MEMKNSHQREHRQSLAEFDWRPGEIVGGPKRQRSDGCPMSSVIGELTARELDDVKIWIANGGEGPQPTGTAAETKGKAP
jgi:hypothetical protein